MPEAAAFSPGPEHERIVMLTGAGLSARAGLPTFRGPDGLWAIHPDLERAMHADALPGAIPELWAVWPRLFTDAQAAGPTPGHRAITRMGAAVITQNIDGLHQAAGSEGVAELHGSAGRAVCLDPRCSWTAQLTDGEGSRAEDHGVPSSCPVCGAPTRPDVVLFDETLPEDVVARADELARTADLFVAVGTSGVVFPAALLAPLARRCGATTVLIDIAPESPEGSRMAFDHVIIADAHEVLPAWERGRSGAGRNPFLDPFD
ncbi:SIR2 family NAD-dependent protein deacylase [Brachybacterium sp. AOP25-B2-12]|uniref:SIR2 family NAD-dependent protein deacylase n=1 Tax=Brachybacterium sp. AOP25-B2-12 TaxID=3457710 RepID=UPI004033E224